MTTPIPSPAVRITRYEVSCLQLDHDDYSLYSITVEWRDVNKWAVLRNGFCLGLDGKWDWERLPSGREDEWVATHRFDLDTALRLATQAAPDLRTNGYTVADALNQVSP